MAQHNCEDLKHINTPSTFSTFTQAFRDHTSNQVVDHPDAASNEDNEISHGLYKFRALTGHQGPLKATNLNWKGCKNKVFVEWETGEKTYEPLSALAIDNPVNVPHMQRKMIFYLLMAGKEHCKEGPNPSHSYHAIHDQASEEIKQIHVWLPHP